MLKQLLSRFHIPGPWLTENRCAECRKPCGYDRPHIFDTFACSSICELMLSDYADGRGIDETRALVKEIQNDPDPNRLKRELKQRGIRR